VPTIAAAVTGQGDAYKYLGASIEKFPSGTAMEALLRENGFRVPTSRPLTGGIASLYTAEKTHAPAP
jgi:demethylmenaquinone methyltransferase/2-methoxy-6-polyprenyl-1,4-benzoquinol methylase